MPVDLLPVLAVDLLVQQATACGLPEVFHVSPRSRSIAHVLGRVSFDLYLFRKRVSGRVMRVSNLALERNDFQPNRAGSWMFHCNLKEMAACASCVLARGAERAGCAQSNLLGITIGILNHLLGRAGSP